MRRALLLSAVSIPALTGLLLRSPVPEIRAPVEQLQIAQMQGDQAPDSEDGGRRLGARSGGLGGLSGGGLGAGSNHGLGTSTNHGIGALEGDGTGSTRGGSLGAGGNQAPPSGGVLPQRQPLPTGR